MKARVNKELGIIEYYNDTTVPEETKPEDYMEFKSEMIVEEWKAGQYINGQELIKQVGQYRDENIWLVRNRISGCKKAMVESRIRLGYFNYKAKNILNERC